MVRIVAGPDAAPDAGRGLFIEHDIGIGEAGPDEGKGQPFAVGEAASPESVLSDLPEDFVGFAGGGDLGDAFIGAAAGTVALDDIEAGDVVVGMTRMRQDAKQSRKQGSGSQPRKTGLHGEIPL